MGKFRWVPGTQLLITGQDLGDGGLRADGQRKGLRVVGFGGVTEDDLFEVRPAVLDLYTIALHDGADDRHDPIKDGFFPLCGGDARAKRFGVFDVVDQEKQLRLGLGVQEQGSRSDVGLLSHLLGGDLVHAVLSEELSGGSGDAVKLLLLIPFTSAKGRGHSLHSATVSAAQEFEGDGDELLVVLEDAAVS